MEPVTIVFPNGNEARAVRSDAGANGTELAAALGLAKARAFLMISGGASNMSETGLERLRTLLADGVARVAAEEQIALIDGGTQVGVMQMVGEGRAASGGDAPLIGVCPATLVTWPGGPVGDDLVPLEPNHTHFVLTDGDSWGAETDTMFALAAHLSADAPSLAILANGGAVARDEVVRNVREGREIVVIAGSGRLADEVAAVAKNPEGADDKLVALVRDGRIDLFEIDGRPESLAALVRSKLFGAI